MILHGASSHRKPIASKAFIPLSVVALHADAAFLDICAAAARKNLCDLQQVDASSLSAKEFERRLRGKKPVLFTNVGRAWGARSQWTQARLIDRFGHERVLSHHVHQGTLDNGPWHGNETVKSIISGHAGPQTYTFNPTHKMVSAVSADWEVPPALAAIQRVGPIISVGKTNSTVRFHQHIESWLAQVSGRKLWIVAPPDVSMSSDMLPCAFSEREFAARPAHRDKLLCVVKSTQAIYIPTRWWHGTSNLDDHSVGVGFLGGWVSALHKAAARGDIPAVKKALLNADAKSLDEEAQDGDPALVAAALRGHVRVLEFLATAAPYETEDESREAATRALLEAAISGHIPVARLLVKMRAHINLPRHMSQTSVLALSAQMGHASLLSYLIKVKADTGLAAEFEPLPGAPLAIKAASRGHRQAVELLLKRRAGSAVDVRDSVQGRTLLQHSLDFPHVTEYVLRSRADVSLTDSTGQSALHLAVEKDVCNPRILNLLLLHRAGLNVQDHAEMRPLHLATRRGHAICVEELLRYGASDDDVRTCREKFVTG
mmetsp:Transcript_22942/g.41685  ORF Transcript_22942/g.41685 Transcript_22942/m.41685 type:complete len:545 (+) Transcript_22942:33-1667(+)